MRRLFHAKAPASLPPMESGQASVEPAQAVAPSSQRSRRGMFGWLRSAGLGLASSLGVGLLWQQTSQTAYADNVGNFNSSTDNVAAVYAIGSNNSDGVFASSGTGTAVYSASDKGYGVWGKSRTSIGVYSEGGPGAYAIFGTSTGTNSAGMYGTSDSGDGVMGTSTSSYGVYGSSSSGAGVYGLSLHSTGVYGEGGDNGVYGSGGTSPGGYGVIAIGSSSAGIGMYAYGPGSAAILSGPVQVYGTLSKGGGNFLIDHPLDPENQSLSHSFVESPDMKNIYDGVIVLDQQGKAVVSLPAWFAALNRDFRYQLTCLGSAASVYIAQEIVNNQFTIAGGQPGMKVCWLVTGIRQDRWAEAYRIPVEQDKPVEQRGRYHYPELYGQPKEKSMVQPPPSPKQP